MSSVGILLNPQSERFPPPPQAVALNNIIVKDFAKGHHISKPSSQSSANLSGHSAFPPEPMQRTLTAGTFDEKREGGLAPPRFSNVQANVQVVTVHPEDGGQGFTGKRGNGRTEDMVYEHVGPPPPSPPASFERDIAPDPNANEGSTPGTQDDEEPCLTQPGLRLVIPAPRTDDNDRPLPALPSQQPYPTPKDSPPQGYQVSSGNRQDSYFAPQPPVINFTSASLPSAITPITMAAAPGPGTPTASRTASAQPPPPFRATTHSGSSPSASSHPSSAATKPSRMRPTRRNTTPVAAAHHSHGTSQSRGILPSVSRFGHGTAFDDEMVMTSDLNLGTSQDEKELATEIQQAAEQIRRERLSKRAKQQAQQAQHNAVEAALSRSDTRRSAGSGKDDIVLFGNIIGEGHVNYILMYNMLTGIRVGVSRCQAKLKRPLTPEDFRAAHKMSFDIMGNELTPSAKYDFKFKDYAPWVFRSLREDVFHLDPADYLLSLTAKYILSELGSPGKSGSFFYFSRDYRFIIKTIRHSEHKFLLSILEKYYEHIRSNPHTLLSRFYGLHRVKLPRGRKIHFVIMNNLFPPHRDIHETYDLKGSTVGREYPEDKARQNPRAVLKDLNWIHRSKLLELGPEKRALLTEQLRRDAQFLKSIDVMDYSLLVGIHNMRRGNKDNVRKNTLKVFSPDIPRPHRKSGSTKGLPTDAALVRRAMRNSQTKNLGEGRNTIRLPDEDVGGDDRSQFLFYQDEGGLRATDEANQSEYAIYYLGIIDILTPWTAVKKLERCWKGLSADRHKISPVPPAEYSQRFFSFMRAVMRGGEGGEKFKPE